MNRAFLTLYAFVVGSVILLGWGLNLLWERVAPDAISTEVRALFSLIETSHPVMSDEALIQRLATIHVQAEWLAPDDMAGTTLTQRLARGDIVAAGDEHYAGFIKRMADGRLLLIALPQQSDKALWIYRALLLVFYGGLALAIFFWVWPLSRDARRLERQTHTLGKDGVPDILTIAPTSALFPLARAFNQMAQRLRELIASHREMTNAVSHELRTPLARMKFALAMLDTECVDGKNGKQLASLQQDIAEMESLISALLTYAGFERQSQQLQTRQGHMKDLLEELSQRFHRHNPRALQLQSIMYTDVDTCCCEWKLMETVLQNAINNAARYAGSCIWVEWQRDECNYYLAIEDDGDGIAVADRERVFDSFVRLYNPDGPSAGSFGLGLAIVHRIMQWHEGHAEFTEPRHGSGARLELRWPVADAQK